MGRIIYESGTHITLYSHEIENPSPVSYTILGVCGEGASCVAYDAETSTGIRVKLKCFDPMENPKVRSSYALRREKFLNACRQQLSLLHDDSTLNITAGLFGIYDDGIGNLWTAVHSVAGVTFDKACNPRRSDLGIPLVREVMESVLAFHKAGWLLLDIKPENILVLDSPGIRGVNFFDFDSFITKTELQTCIDNREQTFLSSSPSSLAPELSGGSPNLRNISESTDRYSVGALLFYAVFGRAPSSSYLDSLPGVQYDFSGLPVSLSADAQLLLSKILHMSLSLDSQSRFDDDGQFLDSLLQLESAVCKPSPALSSIIPMEDPSFIGRKTESIKLAGLLRAQDNCIFVSGVSGIGKTELVLHTANLLGDEFTFSFTTFRTSIRETLLSLPIENLESNDRYTAVLDFLRQLNRSRVIIIDNFDCETDEDTISLTKSEEFSILRSLPVTFVFTTRARLAVASELVLTGMKQKDLFALLRRDIPELPVQAAEELIRLTDSHTLILNMTAAAIKYRHLNLEKVLQSLKQVEDLSGSDNSKYRPIKIMASLYRLFRFRKDEQTVLEYSSLFPGSGIDPVLLLSSTPEKCRSAIKTLELCGWLRHCPERNVITMHALARSTVQKFTRPTQSRLRSFASNLKALDLSRYGENSSLFLQVNELLANYSRLRKGFPVKNVFIFSALTLIIAILSFSLYRNLPLTVKEQFFVKVPVSMGDFAVHERTVYSIAGESDGNWVYYTQTFNRKPAPSEIEEVPMFHLLLEPVSDSDESESRMRDATVLTNRICTLSGGNCLIQTEDSGAVNAWFPFEYINCSDISAAVANCISRPGKLYVIPAEVQAKNTAEEQAIPIPQEAIVSCEYIPVSEVPASVAVTDSTSVFRLFLTEEGGKLMETAEKAFGSIFIAQDVSPLFDTWYYYSTVYGNGTEWYFTGAKSWDSKSVPEALANNYASAYLTEPYRYSYSITPDVIWETPERAEYCGKQQCSIDQLPEKSVQVVYTPSDSESISDTQYNRILMNLKKSLDLIGRPYSIGTTREYYRSITVKTGPDAVNYDILSGIGHADIAFDIPCTSKSYYLHFDSVQNAEVLQQADGSFCLKVQFTDSDKLKEITTTLVYSDDPHVIYLTFNTGYHILSAAFDEPVSDGILYFNALPFINETAITDEYRYIADLAHAWLTKNIVIPDACYSIGSVSFSGGAEYGIKRHTCDDVAIEEILKELYPELEMRKGQGDSNRLQILFHFDPNDNSFHRVSDIIKSLHNLYDFRHSQYDSISYFVIDEEESERCRIFYYPPKSYFPESFSGLCYGGRLNDVQDNFREVFEKDSFYLNFSGDYYDFATY